MGLEGAVQELGRCGRWVTAFERPSRSGKPNGRGPFGGLVIGTGWR
jgi:hypothetical protein